MTWIKLDDSFPDNPKIVEAPPGAVTLYIFGLCYASRHLTDGHLTRSAVAKFGVHKWGRSADVLVTLGLWEQTDNGWRIHDYLDYQRSAEEVRKLSEKRASAGRKGGAKAKQVAKQTGSNLPSKRQAEAEAEAEPSSSPPVTSPPTEPNDAASGGEEEAGEQFINRTLHDCYQLMAQQTLDRHLAEGNTVHNRTAWLKATAANLADQHHDQALHEIEGRTTGRYYPLHVELAETLDPRCGPEDGGNARAAAKRRETLELLNGGPA